MEDDVDRLSITVAIPSNAPHTRSLPSYRKGEGDSELISTNKFIALVAGAIVLVNYS